MYIVPKKTLSENFPKLNGEKMKVLNIGSLNIDKVYQVEHFVQAKETIKALGYAENSGGKGLNQSVALAKAGAETYHAGSVGSDGGMLLNILKEAGADTELIKLSKEPTGHAIIQVEGNGQNCIMICGGANDDVSKEDIDKAISVFEKGDVLLLQNEISNLDYAIEKGHEKGLMVILNPSPISEGLKKCRLDLVDMFILNEVEGQALTGVSAEDPEGIGEGLKKAFPDAAFVLTLGDKGSMYIKGDEVYTQDIFKVKAVDTTAAGDTFSGYFIAGMAKGSGPKENLRQAAAASAIAVSRPGAAPSVPAAEEVKEFLENR